MTSTGEGFIMCVEIKGSPQEIHIPVQYTVLTIHVQCVINVTRGT